jgi:hypothetical protein
MIDNVNILGGTVHTVMRNTDALLGDIKETGLDVEAYKSKYIIVYRDQNAGQSHGTKIGNTSFAILE